MLDSPQVAGFVYRNFVFSSDRCSLHHMSGWIHDTYDLSQDEWIPDTDPIRDENTFYDACAIQENIYVFGLVKANENYLPVKVYSSKTDEWRLIKVEVISETTQPSSMRCKSVIIDGKIFIFEFDVSNAEFITSVNRVLEYDPISDESKVRDHEIEFYLQYPYAPNVLVNGRKVWFVSRYILGRIGDPSSSKILKAVVFDVDNKSTTEKKIYFPTEFCGSIEMTKHGNDVYGVYTQYIDNKEVSKISRFSFVGDDIVHDSFYVKQFDHKNIIARFILSNF